MLFDPASIDAGPVRKVADLPAGAERLTAEAVGIVRVLVNGTTIVAEGEPTGDTPGTLLRSGRDTRTVPVG